MTLRGMFIESLTTRNGQLFEMIISSPFSPTSYLGSIVKSLINGFFRWV